MVRDERPEATSETCVTRGGYFGYRRNVSDDVVERAIDDLVRPVVEADGGRIELVEVAGDVITVHLSGACAGCPGAPYTRAGLIEPALAKALGAVVRVKLTSGR